MTSLSTAPVDTPTSGHEGVQYQISASSLSILEGGKTKHQIQSMSSLSNKQLDHFEIVLARPNTPEGAQPDRNSPSLVTGRHINRPNQTDPVEVDVVLENGQGIDGAVEHYDAIENNGLLEETKQVTMCCCATVIVQELNNYLKRRKSQSNHVASVWVSEIYSLQDLYVDCFV